MGKCLYKNIQTVYSAGCLYSISTYVKSHYNLSSPLYSFDAETSIRFSLKIKFSHFYYFCDGIFSTNPILKER